MHQRCAGRGVRGAQRAAGGGEPRASAVQHQRRPAPQSGAPPRRRSHAGVATREPPPLLEAAEAAGASGSGRGGLADDAGAPQPFAPHHAASDLLLADLTGHEPLFTLCGSGCAAALARGSRARRPPRFSHRLPAFGLALPPLNAADGPCTPPPNSEYYLQARACSPSPVPPLAHASFQCGVAIRTIRDEFPRIFEQDLTYSIFRDDVVFVDDVGLPGMGMGGLNATASGIDAYKRAFWMLRLHGRVLYSRVRVVVLRIWQPRDRQLAVRWSIVASPRLLSSLGIDDIHFDGISEYKLDSRGLIYEHRFTKTDTGKPSAVRNRLAAILAAIQSPAQPALYHKSSGQGESPQQDEGLGEGA